MAPIRSGAHAPSSNLLRRGGIRRAGEGDGLEVVRTRRGIRLRARVFITPHVGVGVQLRSGRAGRHDHGGSAGTQEPSTKHPSSPPSSPRLRQGESFLRRRPDRHVPRAACPRTHDRRRGEQRERRQSEERVGEGGGMEGSPRSGLPLGIASKKLRRAPQWKQSYEGVTHAGYGSDGQGQYAGPHWQSSSRNLPGPQSIGKHALRDADDDVRGGSHAMQAPDVTQARTLCTGSRRRSRSPDRRAGTVAR